MIATVIDTIVFILTIASKSMIKTIGSAVGVPISIEIISDIGSPIVIAGNISKIIREGARVQITIDNIGGIIDEVAAKIPAVDRIGAIIMINGEEALEGTISRNTAIDEIEFVEGTAPAVAASNAAVALIQADRRS